MSEQIEPRKLTLKQKLHAIMSEVSYIQKDKRNDFHRYNYASEAAIKERMHEMLVKYGVLFSCDPVAVVSDRERPTKSGSEIVSLLQFSYCFEDVDSDDKREGLFFGSGADGADKGCYKAITGAIKYVLTTRFLIPTGDDPEEEEAAQPKTRTEKKADAQAVGAAKIEALKTNAKPVQEIDGAVITDAQRKRLFALAKGWQQHEIKALLGTFGLQSSKAIPAAKYEGICEILQRGPKVTAVQELPDPLEYPGERVSMGGVIYRPNAENTGWEKNA